LLLIAPQADSSGILCQCGLEEPPLATILLLPFEGAPYRASRLALDLQDGIDPMSTASITSPVDIRRALACFRDQPPFVRLFVLARHLLAPLRRVAAAVPPHGRILDLGCGHGLFVNLLALSSPERDVLGVDPSAEKLRVASRSSHGLQNVRYLCGRIDDVPGPEQDRGFDAITILDVLYLLPDGEKVAVLRRCRELLAPDGVLVLKTNDTRPRWKYGVVRLEEELMVRALGLTLGGQIHFRGIPEYTAMLRVAGFSSRVYKIDAGRPAPHRLYICRPLP
jgi:2-polyprenyl-3-methyl-5-hydroxy-6-metoxy-1,4-benzoquinol methylase